MNQTTARELLADVLDQLGYQTENGVWRNFYLTGAQELRAGVLDLGGGLTVNPDTLAAMPVSMLVDYLAVRVDGPAARGGDDSLEGVLGGAGAEMGERVGARLGIGPEEAAAVVPLVLPVVLRFLVRRVPYGGMALSLLARTVEQQGYGSLDEIAVRVEKSSFPAARAEGPPPPSLATRLGRLAGKYFPSGDS